MTHDELGALLVERALIEGDFVLRSGRRSSYYLDKYRFETRPDLLAELAARLAAKVAEVEPDAMRLAGPELGAVALAAATSLRSGLPFLIVRKGGKGYGTDNRLEGAFEPGERVCLIEDVVTSGGAAAEAVAALREAGSSPEEHDRLGARIFRDMAPRAVRPALRTVIRMITNGARLASMLPQLSQALSELTSICATSQVDRQNGWPAGSA